MIDELLAHWDLAGADAKPLLGGEQKDVWLVGGDLTLRVYPSFVPLASVDRECRWLAQLGRTVAQVPVPMPTTRGARVIELHGRCAVVAPYVPGRPVDADRATHRRAMAATLARIHRAAESLPVDGSSVHPPLRELDWSSNHWWDVRRCSATAVANDLWAVTRARLGGVPALIDQLDGMPAQVIHNDYGVVNVLVDADEVAGVIDWDWATVDWRLIDLAQAIRTLTGHGSHVEDRPAAFVADYRHAGGEITSDELCLLPALLRLQVIWSALYDLGRACDGRLDRDGATYRARTIQSVDDFAEDLVASPLR